MGKYRLIINSFQTNCSLIPKLILDNDFNRACLYFVISQLCINQLQSSKGFHILILFVQKLHRVRVHVAWRATTVSRNWLVTLLTAIVPKLCVQRRIHSSVLQQVH